MIDRRAILASVLPSGEPRLSGAIVLDQFRVMDDLFGHDVVAAACKKLPEPMQRELASLIAAGWCPLDVSEAIFGVVGDAIGRTGLEVHAEVCRVSVERTVRTVWRIFLRLTTDDALMKRTPLLYTKAFDRGECTAKMVGAGRADLRVSEWPTISIMQMQGLAIGTETVLRVAGRKDVRVHRERTPGGAIFHAHWRV